MSVLRPLCIGSLFCLLWTGAFADEAAKSEFDGARAETYKTIGDIALQIHIFEPAAHQAAEHRPAIVFFFGGGWKGGAPRQFEQQCRYLADRGLVAMTADYRVSSRHGTQVKECVQDAKSAIRWVRTNAARLGIDPQRIAAGGGSAGGHLAACTGVIEGWDEPGESTAVSSVPNAMVLFNPAATLAPVEGVIAADDSLLTELSERMGTDPRNISPGHHARPGQPPSIMFFGTNDSLLKGAKYFHDQLQAAGNRSELKTYDGQKHGFFNFGRENNVYFEQTLTEADRFLSSLGYLSGEPRVADWMAKHPAAPGPGRRRQGTGKE